MPGPYYVLTARTARDFRQLVDDGGTTATARPNAGARTRGLTWVKVTGSAVSGWYPGVVSLDLDGTFSDLTGVVNLASASGAALVTGTRYLCSRTGNTASGVPRFRTVPPGGGGGGDVFGPASATDNAVVRFDGLTGKLIQNSNATLADSGVLTCGGMITQFGFVGAVTISTLVPLLYGPAVHRDASGTSADFAVSILPVCDSAGTKSGLLLYHENITKPAPGFFIWDHAASTLREGKSGTVGNGATVIGGIVTDLGSGGGGGTGTVTSVNVSGGSTGMTFTGGPVTTSGTITMSGTLAVSNGGTGRVSHTAYAVLCGGTTSTSAQQSVASLGTAGQVLTSAGAGALPTWQDAAGGGPSSLPGVSVFGRAPNSTGAPAAITASANSQYLQRIADAVAFAALRAQDLTGTQVRAVQTSNLSLGTSGSRVQLRFDSEQEDALGEFNTATFEFTPAATGVYFVDCRSAIGGSSTRTLLEISGPSAATVKYLSDDDGSMAGGPALVSLTGGTAYGFYVTAFGTGLSALGGATNTNLLIRRHY